VQQRDRRGKRRQRLRAAPVGVEQFAQVGILQRARDQAAQGSLTEAGSRRVDRCQRPRQGLVRGNDAIARMDHLEAVETVPNLAEDPQPAPGRTGRFKCPLLAAVKADEAQRENAATRITDSDHELTPRRPSDGEVEYLRLDEHGSPRSRPGDGGNAGLVFVAQRQMQDEILTPLEPDPAEPIAERWRSVDRIRCRHQPPTTITASASTSAPRGSAATPTAARAG